MLLPKGGRPRAPASEIVIVEDSRRCARRNDPVSLRAIRHSPPLCWAISGDYNLLFRWCVGLNMDQPMWDPTTFSKNRQRLLNGEIAQAGFARVLARRGASLAFGGAFHRG